MRDYKYILIFILPILSYLGLYFKGIYTFAVVAFSFILIPIMEFLIPQDFYNFSKKQNKERSKNRWFTLLLVSILPFLYTSVFGALYVVQNNVLQNYELLGIIFSTGIIISVLGINVAHELGHKWNPYLQFLTKLFLLPALYNHFTLEHNHGHHNNVGTPQDNSTSKKNEWIYFFLIKSFFMNYVSAWKIQIRFLKLQKKSFFSTNNEMLVNLFMVIGYVILIGSIFSMYVLWVAIIMAFLGVVMLESINYVQHYGLKRELLENGKYEKVNDYHSWESNHFWTSIILFELGRHSDHHSKTYKLYAALDSSSVSPKLPFGLAFSIVVALVPPIWFWVMNKRLENLQGQKNLAT